MLRSKLALTAALRPLTVSTLLHTVRGDPGMTTQYYANRYFGPEKTMEVEVLLWRELKKHGKVTIDRLEGPEAPPRWVPLFYFPRRHAARLHRAEEEDLSLLRYGASLQTETSAEPQQGSTGEEDGTIDTLIIQSVHADPEKGIDFYIQQLPEELQREAPNAFRRLREAGVLQRSQSGSQGFVWRC